MADDDDDDEKLFLRPLDAVACGQKDFDYNQHMYSKEILIFF